MARAPRVNVGEHIYHIINRSNGRLKIFENKDDYIHFENLLEDAKKLVDMRIISYCIMPNHWHLKTVPDTDSRGSSPCLPAF